MKSIIENDGDDDNRTAGSRPEIRGAITKVSGPVISAKGMRGSRLYDVVYAGDAGILGEIICLDHDSAVIQVYEESDGICPGEPVVNTGRALSATLGPGLLGSINDGTQRNLGAIFEKAGDFIKRGLRIDALPGGREWEFVPALKPGCTVSFGDVLGTVKETSLITHSIMVPEGINGKLESISQGKKKIADPIAVVDGKAVFMTQEWPVRRPRPVLGFLGSNVPLVTGQRVLDTFFPIAKGGTATIPGPFGSGKTVTQHQIAKWADADVIVYVGCGERGNEIADILEEFPTLKDPKSGKPLMERTIIIANTSNMPVAARETSIYTGITIAEYYRDMGLDVALMADSTSRWAEALREISSRLEEMPGEEGYPAYLSERLSKFYERAGRCRLHSGKNGKERQGSLTIIGAVSPPGGDFSEPVTQSTLRITKAFWGLDSRLANQRHYPSINWNLSYSLYLDDLEEWYSNKVSMEWRELRDEAMKLLEEEARLSEIVKLVGPDALPERERITLEVAGMLREDFLQQSAYDPVDTYTSLKKQNLMLKAILAFREYATVMLENGRTVDEMRNDPIREKISRFPTLPEEKLQEINDVIKKMFYFGEAGSGAVNADNVGSGGEKPK